MTKGRKLKKYYYWIDRHDYFVAAGFRFYRINGFKVSAGKKWLRDFKWKSIDMKGLSRRALVRGYELKGFRQLPDIRKEQGTFKIQFGNKPPIYLKDDQIYVSIKTQRRLMLNQLEKVVRVLQKMGKIKGFTINTVKSHDI